MNRLYLLSKKHNQKDVKDYEVLKDRTTLLHPHCSPMMIWMLITWCICSPYMDHRKEIITSIYSIPTLWWLLIICNISIIVTFCSHCGIFGNMSACVYVQALVLRKKCFSFLGYKFFSNFLITLYLCFKNIKNLTVISYNKNIWGPYNKKNMIKVSFYL